MVTIYLLEKYNNYFNRLIKRGETISDYTANRQYNAFSVDFNPNDGVTTEQIVNWTSSWMPDYLLVTDNSDIEQRWFVTEAIRTRGKQYKLTLKRDVIADFKSDVINAPVFIDKAIIRDPNSPLLLNSENISVNQVKIGEQLLYDGTKCPWLVLYLVKGTIGTQDNVTINIENKGEFIELSTPFAQWEYAHYQEDEYNVCPVIGLRTDFSFRLTGSQHTRHREKFVKFSNGKYESNISYNNDSNAYFSLDNPNSREYISSLNSAFASYDTPSIVSDAYRIFGFKSTNALQDYEGKIIKDSEGRYFKISVQQVGTRNIERYASSNDSSASVYNAMSTVFTNAGGQSTNVPNNKVFSVVFNNTQVYKLVVSEMFDLEGTLHMEGVTGFDTIKTDSALFDIICLPYGDLKVTTASALTAIQFSKNTSLAIMNSIAEQLTSSKVLDLQLLPYCPLVNSTIIDDVLFVGGDQILPIIKNNVRESFVMIAPNESFNFSLDITITPTEYEFDNTNNEALNRKFTNDCTTLRLCSPNYNGLFEMNLAKNGGAINGFYIYCTYKPYSPYIHVSPNFNFVYGGNYKDARGLICGGDFSLGILNSAWNSYEIQNKNYQNIFDRQIQNMDFNYKIQQQEAGWQIAAGTMQGGVSGAVTGGMIGGGYGAAIGAVAGAGASLAGGLVDYANMASRYQESKNLSIDMYNMQLGNVKALPYSVSRTNALTENNKLVPFLEFYECTEREREAYIYKIKYDGMSIGVIDKISNWILDGESSYVKGRLIRLESISDDTHLINAIFEELAKGVYL